MEFVDKFSKEIDSNIELLNGSKVNSVSTTSGYMHEKHVQITSIPHIIWLFLMFCLFASPKNVWHLN